MIVVRCPGCGNRMKTAPHKIMEASKRCVYCGKRFKIHTPGGMSRILGNTTAREPLKVQNSDVMESINTL